MTTGLRECPRCGGTVYHDGEEWTCQECPFTEPTFNFPAVPTDTPSALAALAALVEILGGGFHPDTRAEDYVNFGTGSPAFTEDEAEAVNAVLDGIFAHLPDPYAATLEVT